MLCIINIFRRLRVVCLPSMALSAMACWRCQTTPLTTSANHEGRPARGVAKKIPIDFRNVIAKSRAGTTDALLEMFHSWCEATDKPDYFVRVLLVDYSKAFDHINHELLIVKLCDMGLPAHLVRWMASFLIDHQQDW